MERSGISAQMQGAARNHTKCYVYEEVSILCLRPSPNTTETANTETANTAVATSVTRR